MKLSGPVLTAILLFVLGLTNIEAQPDNPFIPPSPDPSANAQNNLGPADSADPVTAQGTDPVTAQGTNIQKAGSDTVQREEPQAVLFRGDTLFVIQTMLGPYSPQERMESSERSLARLQKLDRIRLDSFQLTKIGEYSVISYMGQPIIHISEEDALQAGTDRQQLEETYLSNLKDAFSELLESRTGAYWVKRIGYTLLTLLGLILIFIAINRIFLWINKKLSQYEKGIMRKRTSLIKYFLPNQSPNVFLFLSKMVKVILIVLILFFYLPLLFSFFPQTENLVDRFYQYIADPVKSIGRGLLNFLPNLFYIFVIIVIARYLIRILNMLSREIEEERLKIKGFHRDWAQPTANIVKIILYAFTLVFIFPYLPGSDSPAFRGVSIFLGVLFSLGSTSAIANIVAGIVITYMRPFMIGDRVKIGESVGDVLEKNLLVTRIRTIKNEDITIPNATIINAHLWNYSKSASSIGIILHTTVTLGYNIPSKRVSELLLKAAQNTKDLSREFKPFVLQKSLSDFYVEYELNVYTKQPKKMAMLKSELNRSILEVFSQANVEILSPHYSAYRDGNDSSVPVSENPNGPEDPNGPKAPADPDAPGDPKATADPKVSADPKKPIEPKPPKTIVDQVIDKVTGRSDPAP